MVSLEDVLRDIERRLATLEARQSSNSGAEPLRPEVKKPPQQPAPPIATNPVSVEKTEGVSGSGAGSFFGIIGIAFLVLAAVFFLKLTIDSGWLNPQRQVLLAAFFGLGCLLLPHLVRRLADDYGALLSGAGATILHVTWLGAFALHKIISAETALVMASLVGVLTILLNANIGNAVFVLVAVSGTYLAAPLTAPPAQDVFTLSSFFLIWNLSFSALALTLKRRDVLLVAAFFAVLTVALFSSSQNPLTPELARSFLILQAMQFVIFATAMFVYSTYRRAPLREAEGWLICLLLLIYYAEVYSLLQILMPGFAPWAGTALSLSVLLLYRVARNILRPGINGELPSTAGITTFASLALAHSLYFNLSSDQLKPLFSLVLGIVAAGFLRGTLEEYWRWPMRVMLLVIGYGAVLTFSPELSGGLQLAYHFSYGLCALVVFFILSKADKPENRKGLSPGALLLGFAHIEMLMGLYRLSQSLSGMSGSLFVSVSWGMYALAVLAWAAWARDKVLGQSAVLILAAVSLKAAVYDVLATGNLVRVGSLFVAGVMLYLCGWVYRRMQAWPSAKQ